MPLTRRRRPLRNSVRDRRRRLYVVRTNSLRLYRTAGCSVHIERFLFPTRLCTRRRKSGSFIFFFLRRVRLVIYRR